MRTKKVNAIEKVNGTVEMNVKDELLVIGGFTSEVCVNAIKNTKMRKAVKDFRNAVDGEVRSKWEQAKAIASMDNDIRREFGDDKTLAEFLGMSKGHFSKMQRVGKIAKEAEEKGITLPKCDLVLELLTVENDKHGNQNLLDCAAHVAEMEMNRDEVRDYVKSFEKDGNNEKTNTKKVESEVSHAKPENEMENESEAENGNEIGWVSPIRVIDKSISSLSQNQFDNMVRDLVEVLCSHGINKSNIWVSTYSSCKG